ncbi:hypothetical protein IT575_15065 [bacterium]|nr:hypothetical protein [bacterium]
MQEPQEKSASRDEVAAHSVVEPGKPVPINELYAKATEVNFFSIFRASAHNKYLNERFSVPESRYWRLFWRPWPITLGFGSAALLLILLALYGGELLGVKAIYAPTWFKLLRVGLMFGGFICLMLAAPLYKQRDWSPDKGQKEYDEMESFRERYSRVPFKRPERKQAPAAQSEGDALSPPKAD